MMSPDHNNNKKAAVLEPAGKEESQGSGGKKSSTSRPPQEAALKCPRCDSQNTKFCYYNNYSLSQPRHFCKTCRRYWTRGGALRSVPIGGGCRKNKKTKHPSSSSSSSTSTSRDTSSNIGGLRFFQGLSPAMDFQLGGTNTSLFSSFGEIQLPIPIQKPIPATNSAANHCFSLENPSPTCSSSVSGFGIGTSSHGLFHQELGMGGGSFNRSFASSTIESLSSINQDMHWKLQQQRLAMLFVGERKHDRENDNNNNTTDDHHVLIPPSSPSTLNPKSSHNNLLFQNLDSSKPADQSCGIGPSIGTLSTEWFFDNSYAPIATASTNANANENENEIEIPSSSSWSTGIQAWTDYTRYTGLP